MVTNHTKGRPGRVVVLAGLLVLLGSTDILAQRWDWPEKAENLQVFPEDSYDFGERSMLRLAERLVEQDKPDDAVAFLHLNLEMYPESWQTHVVFGQFYMQQEDNENAIASLEKAYELNPVPWIQQQLERLKSQ